MTPTTQLYPEPAEAGMFAAQAEADGEDQDDYRYLVMPVRLPGQVPAPLSSLA